MIREYKLHKSIPTQIIANFKQNIDVDLRFYEWDQSSIENEDIKNWLSTALNADVDKMFSVFHTIKGDVEKHIDAGNKSCILIPISLEGKPDFFVDGNTKIHQKTLEVGKIYRFNDHNEHWLENHDNSVCEIITIDVL